MRYRGFLPEQCLPKSVKEVTGEMSRLRELARRMRVQPESVKRYATHWLGSPLGESAAIARWLWVAPEGLLAGDLHDTLAVLHAIAKGDTVRPEIVANRLEAFANVLEPALLAWLHDLQATPEAQQAKNEATIELVRVLANKELPKCATKAVLANPIVAMLLAGNAMEATDLNSGEWPRHVALRREAEWTRHKNLLLRVVDDAAVAVVASGGDPAPLFAIAEIAVRGNVVEFSQQWPAVAVIMRTAEAKRKAAALAGKEDDAQDRAERAGEVGEAERTNQGERDAFESDSLEAPADGITEPDVSEAPSTTPQAIPVEKRTKPMSKKEALHFLGWPPHAEDERQAVDWLTQSIRDGEYRWEKINHKKGVYHIDDFPAECHKEIRKV